MTSDIIFVHGWTRLISAQVLLRGQMTFLFHRRFFTRLYVKEGESVENHIDLIKSFMLIKPSYIKRSKVHISCIRIQILGRIVYCASSIENVKNCNYKRHDPNLHIS